MTNGKQDTGIYVFFVRMKMNSIKIILDLCGGTGSWSKPYQEAGYDVRIITWPEKDVRLFEYMTNVYGVLAAPPCTDFAGSGAQYWKQKDDDGRTLNSLSIVDACIRIITVTKPVFWCMENPVGRLNRWLGKPVMYFNPCDYGDTYTKKTALWGMFNEPVKTPVEPIFYTTTTGKRGSFTWAKLGGKSERTKVLRSITPSGFAQAFFEVNK